MNEDKLTRELWMNLKAAYTKFHQEVTEFIHKAKYPISSLNRDLNGEISSAIITMPDGGRIVFSFGEWKVMLPAKDNPINMDLLQQWEGQEIDSEIAYHLKQLYILKQRKQEILKGIKPSVLLYHCNWTTETQLFLVSFCIMHAVKYYDISIEEFVSKFKRTDILKEKGCDKVTIAEIEDKLEAFGYKLK
jgi:hypothetical protein